MPSLKSIRSVRASAFILGLFCAFAVSGSGAGPVFTPVGTFDVAASPYSVAVGDFNGDGKPDIVVASHSGNVSILLNDTPAGATSTSYSLAASIFVGSPTTGFIGPSVAVGDFNGDGKLDVAVSPVAGNQVAILTNTTAPGASSASFTLTSIPAGNSPFFVAVADFNGDGKPDLAVTNSTGSGTVSILLNTTAPGAASPSFTLAANPSVGTHPIFVAVGDFNGDGKPDLAVVNKNNNLAILINTTAAGDSTASFTLTTLSSIGDLSVAAADFNGDGKPDLAVENYEQGTVSILLNNTAPGSSSASFTLAAALSVGNGPYYVAAADFNGDGKPDLVVTNNTDNTVSILLNNTAPGSSNPDFALVASPAVGQGPTGVAVADLNGDGTPDIVVANQSDNTVSVLLDIDPPVVNLTPASLSFGNQRTGTPSASKTIQLTNTGGGLTIKGIATSGDYTQSNNCPASLAAGSSCMISVSFKPSANAPRPGSLSIRSNASTSPDVVSLSGTGIGPVVSLSANSLNFGNIGLIRVLGIIIGATSLPQTVTVTNTGTDVLNIGSIATSGDFKNTTTCGATLAAGANCTISIVFKPSTVGARTGTTTIQSDAASSPDRIQLTGTGTGISIL